MSFGGDVFKLIRHGEWLFASSADGTARHFSTSSRKEIRKFEGHAGWVYAIAYHPGKKLLISGAHDGDIRF